MTDRLVCNRIAHPSLVTLSPYSGSRRGACKIKGISGNTRELMSHFYLRKMELSLKLLLGTGRVKF